jgi:hypothetical protein
MAHLKRKRIATETNDAEWSNFVQARIQRKKRRRQIQAGDVAVSLTDILQQIPDVWCMLDPRSMQNVCVTHKSASQSLPLTLIRQMPIYDAACKLRHTLGKIIRQRSIMNKFHAIALSRTGDRSHWKLNPAFKPHRTTLIGGGLNLLTAQATARPHPFHTQHFCIECRKVVQTGDVIRNQKDYIQFEIGLLSESFLCRAFFPNPSVRKQLYPRRFMPEDMGFHDRPHLCRACAETHDYLDIDAYCAEHKLPSRAFSTMWRHEYGAVVTLMPFTSPFHNGRFAPRRLLDRASSQYRTFVLPHRLADIPLHDICAWSVPSDE